MIYQMRIVESLTASRLQRNDPSGRTSCIYNASIMFWRQRKPTHLVCILRIVHRFVKQASLDSWLRSWWATPSNASEGPGSRILKWIHPNDPSKRNGSWHTNNHLGTRRLFYWRHHQGFPGRVRGNQTTCIIRSARHLCFDSPFCRW